MSSRDTRRQCSDFVLIRDVIPRVLEKMQREHSEWECPEIVVGEWRFIQEDYAIEHTRAGWDFCLHNIHSDRDIVQLMEDLSHKTWMTTQAMSDFWHLCSRIGLFPKGADARVVIEAKQKAKERREMQDDA